MDFIQNNGGHKVIYFSKLKVLFVNLYNLETK